LLGADVARAEAEALFFVVANEGLAAGIDNDDAAGLVKDGAAALLVSRRAPLKSSMRRGPGAAHPEQSAPRLGPAAGDWKRRADGWRRVTNQWRGARGAPGGSDVCPPAPPGAERHSVQRSEADRYAAAVAYPLPPVVAGVVQFELRSGCRRLFCAGGGGGTGPAHFSAEAVLAHFFAEAGALVPCSAQPKAQRSAAPAALAEQAVAPRPEESAARDAAAEPPRAAGHAGVAPEAAQDAAEEPRPEAAAWGAAACRGWRRRRRGARRGCCSRGRRRCGSGGGGVRRPAARDAAEVRRLAAPGVRAPARPSAVLSVFRQDRLHHRPAPSPAARFARGDGKLANCVAVRADVASNTRRRFVMMVWVPGNFWQQRSPCKKNQEKHIRFGRPQITPNAVCVAQTDYVFLGFSCKDCVLPKIFRGPRPS